MALIKVGGESTVCRANSVRSLLRSSPADRQDTPSPSFSHIPLILTSPRRRTHHPPFAAITVCLSTTPPTPQTPTPRTDGRTANSILTRILEQQALTLGWSCGAGRHSTLRPVSILSTLLGHILDGLYRWAGPSLIHSCHP